MHYAFLKQPDKTVYIFQTLGKIEFWKLVFLVCLETYGKRSMEFLLGFNVKTVWLLLSQRSQTIKKENL